ncbi:retrovirus-related pol polyprotein from transposon TNT 1-94 [Tanacetum coccineum]|uniref:Retrovirus-related pol polyprotein from transposon TNT 1-94 n=1 Tax=Tanacetum coccineum TaxID=301880 RepID=A0ABQ5FYD6_9ASTR
MKLESTNSGPTAKLPILKLGEYKMWVIRIKQYFQIQDYALWEVIENGNSCVSVPQTTQENGILVTKMYIPVTAEEKTNKKNDVKARGLLLMALPNEHQLTFSQYPNAKSMFASIETRFGGNAATKKTQKTLLKQQYKNFSASSAYLRLRLCINDLYNNFKIVEQKLKKIVGTSSGGQNMAFMTALSTSSTNDANIGSPQVSAASPSVNAASPQVCTASVSDNNVYAFMIENPNGFNVLHQDLEQIHEDDLEAIDLKWQLSLLSVRAKKYYQRTGKKIFINANDTAGDDKSKQGGQSEIRQLQEARNNEDTIFKEMLAIDWCRTHEGKPQHDDKGFVDSGCSRHMTGNIAYLSDFKEFDGGYVAFGGGAYGDKITGKGTLKTDNIDFKDVYFVNELNFNLFSVSQMCDKNNYVLFTDTECLVLSLIFKLPDENQILLKIPKKDNMYSFDMKNIIPKESLTCLVAKATLDESCLAIGRDCRFTCVFFLTTKDETSEILKNFIKEIENLVDKKVKIIRSDNGTEFKNKLLDDFCREKSVSTACYVQNRVLVVKPHNKTPYELFRGFKPALSFMRPFGCHVTILNTLDSLGKFNGKSDEGTSEEVSQDCIMMPIWKDTSYFDSPTKDVDNGKPKTADDAQKQVEDVNTASPNEQDNTEEELEVDLGNITNSYIVPSTPNTRNHKDYLIDNVIGEVKSTVQTKRMSKPTSEQWFLSEVYEQITHNTLNTCLYACFLSHIELTSIAKALSDSSWVEAMQEELLQFKLQQVSTVILLIEKKAIGTKWVFKNKKDERGIVIRNKARLVAQGHRQEEGIHYEEVFAPVARIEAIRLFLVYASFMGFLVYQMDINSAFLYGTIEEEVYVTQPPGFKDPDHPDKVYKVVKALYGLHQAPRAWYETLANYLLSNRFKRGKIDQTLFIKKQKGDILLLQVYVDDIIFGSTNKELSEILKKFNYSDVMSASTLVDLEKPLVKDGDADDVDVHLYRSMIGSLMYLTTSRPDIMFAVCACARFQVTPKTSHLLAVKRIFRYLKGKPTLGLWYSRDSPFELVAYTDSDYAGATQDRKSTTGGFVVDKIFLQKVLMQADFSTWSQVKHIEYLMLNASPLKLVMRLSIRSGDNKERLPPTALAEAVVGQWCQDTILGDVNAQTRFEIASKQSNDPPLSRGYTLGSGEDMMPVFVYAVKYMLMLSVQVSAAEVNLIIYTSCIEQFWATAKVQTVNGVRQLQALVDKKRVIVTESSIRNDLYLDDAEGTDCLPTATIFEELARMGTGTAEVPHVETEMRKVYPPHSNDPKPSAKDAQAKEIAALKKRIQRLERRKMSRPTGLKRLRKVGMSRRVESSEDQESLGAPEDASKQGRSIEDIDADVDVSLVDETQERQNDDLMFDSGVLEDDVMHVEAKVDGKDEQSTKPNDSTVGEAVTTASVDDSVVPTTIEEITLAQTLIQIKAAKPKVPSEFRVPQETQPSSSKDKGNGIMIEPEVPLNRKDQISLDEQIARDIQAKLDAELLEEQKLARKQQEEANIALIKSWENTQAMMEADRLLAERLQSKEKEELTNEEKAKLFMELMEKRRKHFATLRAQEKRNKPLTKA